MSVTSLLELPDVCAQIDRLLPACPPRINVPLRAPPVTSSYPLVGTAFDYALRFDLQRRYPHARTKRWVAEIALTHVPDLTSDRRMRNMAERVVTTARADFNAYMCSADPAHDVRAAMAAHAIRLAKLDRVYRADYLDPEMDSAEPGDVEDILRLLNVAPYEALAHPTILWLNPTFGRYSQLVGGADCDLVSGDRLIDIKVTKNDTIRQDYLRQLVCYALLGRGVRGDNPAWPDVRHIGIYFARHGHLWTISMDAILSNPAYAEVEAWYYEHAAEQYGATLADLAAQQILLRRKIGTPKADAKKPPVKKPAAKKPVKKPAAKKPAAKKPAAKKPTTAKKGSKKIQKK